jgi:hypothetical protein
VYAEAERRALVLKQEQPEEYGDKSLAAVRGFVMAADEALREALAALPPEEPVEVEEEPVLEKAAGAFAKIDAAARERYPDLYDESPSRARVKISEKRADLGDGYHREFWAAS